ncbi:hypothetical protein [Aureispira anguillae]|uniref:Uncharacterized protein n=1 Tax=Aureispira anguillae TaxID=2864201 RepID=A0A916DVM7_9BACT|nr:hypothetical protein [Aureispira anguillae]BDS14541.1 hypothetical protein AsAng_0053210 [Aureispira anguillae]
MKINSIIILFLCFLFVLPDLMGQKLVDDTQTLKVLVFEHLEKDKKKLVSQGGRIKYKLESNSKQLLKGTLEEIKENAMIVDGKEVLFADCSMIAGRVTTEEVLIGGIATGIGFTTIVVGAASLGNIIVGGTVIAGGVAALVAGIILITKYKRFNLNKGWEVHSGQIIYSATN